MGFGRAIEIQDALLVSSKKTKKALLLLIIILFVFSFYEESNWRAAQQKEKVLFSLLWYWSKWTVGWVFKRCTSQNVSL